MTDAVITACAAARERLAEPAPRSGPLPVLFAAGLCAVSALLMAGAVILGPGTEFRADSAEPEAAPSGPISARI